MADSKDFESLQSCWRKASASGDGPAREQAERAIAAAIEADSALRARVALAGAIAPEGATLESVAAEWLRLDPAARRAILAGPNSRPSPQPAIIWSSDMRNAPQPEPIIWRDNPSAAIAADAVVSEGECAVLAGAGSAGKSWLAIRLAVEAARAAEADEQSAAACGLRIRGGTVVLLSWEMSAKRIDMAAAAMAAAKGVACLPRPAPLFPLDPDTRAHAEGRDWRPAWDAIAAAEPTLIVLDTGPKAMGGIADANAGGPVIAFLQAIERELAEIAGCAALVICHDTKAQREAGRAGEDPGAGAVAGSGQWYDSPRGVLHLSKIKGGEARVLECIKASNGREHWGATLMPLYDPPGKAGARYAGLQLGERVAPNFVQDARRRLKAETEADDERTATSAACPGDTADQRPLSSRDLV